MTTPADQDRRTDLRAVMTRPDGWREQSIPDSSAPVRLFRLRHDRSTGASVSLVHFPAGWTRPTAGSYSVAEEFVLVDGELEMNGRRFTVGDWVFVPAGAGRVATAVTRGAVAVAWFGGVPDWRASEASGETGEVDPIRVARASPPGILLEPEPPHGGTELVSGQLPASTRPRDVLDAERWLWWWLPAGVPWPGSSVRTFVRTW